MWTLSSEPFPGAHFATFPTALVEPCILAGTSERGCCPQCGAPWRRVMKTLPIPDALRSRGCGAKMDFHARAIGGGQAIQDWREANPPRTVGWEPTCACGIPDTVPCTVLDPFAGAGTVGVVARRLGRAFVGIELSAEYAAMARRRIAGTQPPLPLHETEGVAS